MATREERIAIMRREYFKTDKYENPRDRKRIVPMRVLNLSFLRTGSVSLKAALDILGFRCYHSVLFYSQIRDVDMWIDAVNAKYFDKGKRFTREDWDQLLGHHDALSADAPPICFAEDLITAYPEAKVILIERPVEKWFRSYDENVIKSVHDRWINFVSDLDPNWLGKQRDLAWSWTRGWMKANNIDEHRANARRVYTDHYDLVRRVTPPERLLEFKLDQGWEPLCKFLDVPVPQDVPFPHVNDSEQLWDLLNLITMTGLRNFAWKAARWVVVLLILGAAFWTYKHR